MTHYVHVYGPDDLREFATSEQAHAFANNINKSLLVYLRHYPINQNTSLFVAIVHEAEAQTCDSCPACGVGDYDSRSRDEVREREEKVARAKRSGYVICEVIRRNEDGSTDLLGEIRRPDPECIQMPPYDMSTGRFDALQLESDP